MGEYFINQSLPTNGVGSLADPFNTAPALVRNNLYLFTGTYRGSLTINTEVNSDQLVSISSFGDDRCIFTSRLQISTGWTAVGGGIYSVLLATTPYVFYVGFDGESAEVPEDTATPTTPADGKWGKSGLTLYYAPGAGMPTPGDTGEYYEFNGGSLVSGIRIATSYVDVYEVSCLRSVYHGLQASNDAAGSPLTNITIRQIEAAYNGNQTYNGPRIGNGISILYNIDGCTIYDCDMHHNVDHGGNAEGLSGTNPRPRNVLYDKCRSYQNGSRGYSFQSNSGTYPVLNCDVYRGECYENGSALVTLPGSTAASNGKAGVYHTYSHGGVDSVLIKRNKGAGIWFNAPAYDGANGTITQIDNCIIVGNNVSATAGPGDAHGISISRNTSGANGGTKGKISIRDSLVANNGTKNIHQYYTPFTGVMEISNTVVFGATQYDIQIEGASTSDLLTIKNTSGKTCNIRIVGTTYNNIDTFNASQVADNNIAGSMSFIDEINEDYRSNAGAILFGAGVDNGITVDIDGLPVVGYSGRRAIGPHAEYPVQDGYGPWVPFDGTLPVLTTESKFALTRTVKTEGKPLTANQVTKYVVEDLK